MALSDASGDKFPRKFGKYHLLSPLAQGGMGALYLAVNGDRGLERLIVVKTVLPHLADAEYLARFRDEAKVVVKLSHGNLIPVFDAGQVDGELFIAMDFVEGRDLRAVWNRCAKKQVAFPIDIAAYITKELLRGLHYAHSYPELQLVHRDVSPPNVLISFSGQVRLTDFGLASSTLKLEKTAPGIIYGKVAYMSPEQARGEKLDGASDQYAAAIVLWELLTGRQLFPPGKDQPQDLVARAKNPDVMRPSKRAPRVPEELDEICVRALHSDRAERFASCDDMRIALQAYLAKHAPATDEMRVATFLRDLFADDIEREQLERNAMIESISRRALTMPPTDEFRQMLERSTKTAEPTEPPVRSTNSVGRRASDLNLEGIDRRQSNNRRAGSPEGGVDILLNPSARIAAPSPVAGTDTSDPAEWIKTANGSTVSAAIAAATALAPPTDVALGERVLIGAVIDGRYRIDELIGEGGMGKVYLAEHVEIGKRVAVKVLHPSYSRMPDLVERFRREARAASKIGHPNIVDVTDSGTTSEGSVYFVMEYLEGVELGAVLDREGSIEAARAVRITIEMCRARSAAHAVQVIHRDLKPENIFLVTRDGNSDFVKVLDFGIAKSTEAEEARERKLTSPGRAMGTPEYMAPEQAAGKPADARSDVYAVGAILYEMITGVTPYQGDNFMEVLTKKATIDPLPPVALRPELPAELSAIVMRSMARDPNERPANMDALAYELTKYLAGRGAAVANMLGVTMSADGEPIDRRRPQGTPNNSYRSGHAQPANMTLVPIPGSSGDANATALDDDRAPASVVAVMRSGATPVPVDPQRQNTEPASPKRATGVLGWVGLAAVVFGGLAVVIYIAAGERKHGVTVDAAASLSVVAPTVVPVAATIDATMPIAVDAGAIDARVEVPEAPPVESIKSAKHNEAAEPAPAHPSVAKFEMPTSNTQADRLLDLARAALNKRDLSTAHGIYKSIAESSFFTSQGYLGLAKVALIKGDLDVAHEAAQSALRNGGGVPANLLLGAIEFKQGDFQSALNRYRKAQQADANNSEASAGIAATLLKCTSCQ